MDKSKKICYTSGGYDGLRKKEPSEMTKNDGKRMVRKGSSELRPEGSEEVNHVEMWRKNVSYCKDSKCKGPVVNLPLMCFLSEGRGAEPGQKQERTLPEHGRVRSLFQ